MIDDLKYKLAKIAKHALYGELITYPKPGLVSLVDSGSHSDMDAKTFLASIQSLNNYFIQIADAGSNGSSFADLKQLGCEAELAMLNATNQINTHRGAIFILGLLVAGVAYSLAHGEKFADIRLSMSRLWAKDLFQHQVNADSHGARVRQQFHLTNVVIQAAHGFPLIFALSYKYTKLCQTHDVKRARLIMFFVIMQELDDTNLVHRGGLEALKFAKFNSKIMLNYENNPPQFYARALKLHHEFVRRNLSPGGCADVLAAVIFLHEARLLWD